MENDVPDIDLRKLLFTIEEKEKSEIASELHDSIQRRLKSLKYSLLN